MTKRATPFCTRDYVHSPEDLLCKPQFRRLRAISLLLFVACSDGQPAELPNKIPLLDRERFKSSTVSEDAFNGPALWATNYRSNGCVLAQSGSGALPALRQKGLVTTLENSGRQRHE